MSNVEKNNIEQIKKFHQRELNDKTANSPKLKAEIDKEKEDFDKANPSQKLKLNHKATEKNLKLLHQFIRDPELITSKSRLAQRFIGDFATRKTKDSIAQKVSNIKSNDIIEKHKNENLPINKLIKQTLSDKQDQKDMKNNIVGGKITKEFVRKGVHEYSQSSLEQKQLYNNGNNIGGKITQMRKTHKEKSQFIQDSTLIISQKSASASASNSSRSTPPQIKNNTEIQK